MTILRRHSGTIALACAVVLTFAIASGIVYAIEWYTRFAMTPGGY